MYIIVVGAAISRPRAIDNRPYMRHVNLILVIMHKQM